MSMRILITGGAGFIGTHLCQRLLERGDEVICVDNFLTGEYGYVENVLAPTKKFTLVKHDVTEYTAIDGPLDAIFHLASPASPSDYLQYPIETLKVGALGTHNILVLALSKNAQFLLTSTSEIYGDPQIQPQSEDYWGHVNPIGPRGVYDEAKRFAEALTMAYHRTHGLKTNIARIFNTYGPRMRLNDGRAIPTFLSQSLRGEPITVFGGGEQTRSFCFISDTIDGLCLLMESNFSDPVNIGSPSEKTVLEIAEYIRELTGGGSEIVHNPLPENDPKQRRPSIERAKKHLGWEPKVSLEEGITAMLDDFRERIESESNANK